MFAQARHARILQLLRGRGPTAIALLQARVPASPATLRRDLHRLEQLGRIIRMRGGAMEPSAREAEQSFTAKARIARAAKDAIARRAAARLPDGATVFIDAGSTTLEAGRLLLTRPGMTLYTNSLPLLAHPGPARARLIGLGGEVREISRALVGTVALAWLGRLHFDFALLGASGLDAHGGASTTEPGEATVKQEALRRADRALLLCDATKWNRPATVTFAPWDRLDEWISDAVPTSAQRRTLRARGVILHHVVP